MTQKLLTIILCDQDDDAHILSYLSLSSKTAVILSRSVATPPSPASRTTLSAASRSGLKFADGIGGRGALELATSGEKQNAYM